MNINQVEVKFLLQISVTSANGASLKIFIEAYLASYKITASMGRNIFKLF